MNELSEDHGGLTDAEYEQAMQEAMQALAEIDEANANDPNYVPYPWTPEEQEANEALSEYYAQQAADEAAS